jgi:hypothetical protein
VNRDRVLAFGRKNTYTQAVPEALRDANSKVVRMVLPTTTTTCGTIGVPQLFPRTLQALAGERDAGRGGGGRTHDQRLKRPLLCH